MSLNILYLLISASMCVSNCSTTIRLDDTGNPYDRVRIRTVVWDGGTPRFTSVTMIRVNVLDFLDMLRESEIRKELELVKSQEQSLDRLLKVITKKTRRFEREWRGRRPSKVELQELSKVRSDCKNSLNDILLQSQQERLAQVRNRVAIRNVGIGNFLNDSSGTMEFSTSADEKRSINQTIETFRHERSGQITAAFQKTTKTILSPLTKPQRERFNEYVTRRQLGVNQLDIFLAQIKYSLIQTEKFGEHNDKQFQTLLDCVPSYWVTYDGRFKAAKSGRNPILVPSFVQKSWDVLNEKFEFTADQKTELTQATSRYWQEVKKQQEIRGRGVITESLNDDFKRAMDLAAEELNKSYEDVFLPNQIEMVRRSIAENLLPRYGLFANLLTGDVGREINLTNGQRKKIRSLCKKEIARLEAQLLKWDEMLLQKVRSCLKKENRHRMDSAIGKRLTHVVPTIQMLVGQSTH